MNHYPLWKNLLIGFVIALCALYALPNLFGEDPAVQISAGYARDVKMDENVKDKALAKLKAANIEYGKVELDEKQLLIRFADTDLQLQAYTLLKDDMGSDFVVAQNLAPATPNWLRALGAQPMYLGLDLRGGVHFLMEVDMDEAIKQDEELLIDELKLVFREKKLYNRGLQRAKGQGIKVLFREAEYRTEAKQLLAKDYQDLKVTEFGTADEYGLQFEFTEESLVQRRRDALQQNITTLRNRVNELGVAEPVIQQQGEDRIIVQLPGIQDTARAKEILGATASLEFRLTEGDYQDWLEAENGGTKPRGSKLYHRRDGSPVLLKNSVIVSGDQITNATSGFDQNSGSPATHVTLNGKGGKRMLKTTTKNVGKPMAVVFIEYQIESKVINGQTIKSTKKKEEVVNIATIQEPFSNNFQITGLGAKEATNLALILRAGALKAPMEIVEERTIGPSLGKENIAQGKLSIMIGFIAVMIFMVLRYKVFGLAANVALLMNVVILIALLSLLQATLTLPGMAGIVLTLGMAVDANVLIFERIREELANNSSPQASIFAGYEKAFGTIADANITTLIAAVMLLSFGTGPIKGFAVTLSLGIITSMFTAILVSRAIINIVYGNKSKVKLAI
ncbi:protein translocase subunit SecD [Candidatus Albibeggiatoa sp. nov. NOAA]|uniref:protein translocase subunit SecD n=1 Tax=Candidatus Albibeggiatoa sp. nov. NOAA TaxID=3162724 RepID=UPI0032F7901E|nr:protein translocase subunit SecD [Thiotrichaceae bacterium]